MTSPATLAYRLRTFGATTLEQREGDGAWDVVIRASKPLALLIYLSTQPGRSLSREQLADSLWGDESPERARASLRQALYALKQTLGDDVLQAEREVVVLREGAIESDRDLFLTAMRRNDLDEMLAVYGGAFCDALSVGGATEYERWLRAERAHLERLVLDRAQNVVPARIAAGELHSALDAARALEKHFSERSEVQVLLFDALVAAGGRLEAVERLSAHATQLSAKELSIPPQIAERIARVRRAAIEPPSAPNGSLAAIGQQLVGRDALLGELSREAESARAGGARRVVLNGPAGVGKTRVLDELEARLRLRGARIVRVGLLPSMRDVEYSALVELVRALCELPGALGVSEHSASRLLRVLPELRSRFPGAVREGDAIADGVRGLQSAVADLLSSVSEERLVVLMLDNVHHADSASLQVLHGTQAHPKSRLLELWTSRSGREFVSGADTSVIDVMPLAEPDVISLLASVAKLPDEAWMHGLATALYRRSRGVPLLVLASIRSLGAAGLLRITRGTWASDRADALLQMANATAGTAALVAGVDAVSRLALEVLAAWGRPMEERDLLGTLALAVRSVGADEWRACLRGLESLGLVQSRDVTWAIAHDSVADELRATPSTVLEDAPRELLFAYWSRPSRLSATVLEQLALIVGQEDSPRLALKLARAAQHSSRLDSAGLRGRELVRRIARQAGHPEWERELDRSLGFFARQSDGARLSIAVVLTLVVMGLAVLGVRLQPRIIVESVPMAEFGLEGMPQDFVVQPRVRIADGFGRVSDVAVPVRVAVDHGSLVGETIRRTENGRVQYEGIGWLRGPVEDVGRPVHVDFRGPWWVRSARVEIPGSSTAVSQDAFQVISLKANGEPVSSDYIISAAAGDSIRFELTFEYTTVHPTANYIVGAMPTWGRRERSAIRLAGLPRPVVDAWRTVSFTVEAPGRAAEQYVIILMELEDTVDHLFSGTSWTRGAPVWNDGDDFLDQPRTVFEELRLSGRAVIAGKQVPRAVIGRAILIRFQGE
jgi:DNA-binding SARP family transcriptional activator